MRIFCATWNFYKICFSKTPAGVFFVFENKKWRALPAYFASSIKLKSSTLMDTAFEFGGDEGARTLDLLRDRQTL